MPTIKYTREDITKLENERYQFQLERDSLIKDIQKLREEKALIVKFSKKYMKLKEHIRLKAKNNPGNSRYIALVHFIDDLEGGTDD
ncbi:hypothetical protein [Mammaliicoccus sciuri]|uniref:hypothetical protein n=1 Tax=Mammaliicoccus sciuri TaxID=1296 RepID=UPI001FB5008A|nr:hypothetical protein [Mammaliicoccus sciuri]MCJ0969768.1 hypothetical protein [Mammaliicoccus sciuri]